MLRVPSHRWDHRPVDAGSAPADFVLVGSFLTVLFLAIVQLTLVLHVRNTLVDAASSGARYGALADRGLSDATGRTAEIVQAALGPAFASEVEAVRTTSAEGTPLVEVRVRAPLPLVGFVGPRGVLGVSGHAPLS
ncbi:TadE family protein [Sinomonas humi]|uniref:Pilus assembly protein TadE n=1 Tax=Sinomonas humi TaxID=1338436 RepID=A0A0B2ASM7_9MICC|nr:TadE family protein [Sinomonas humi]KHL04985.1 pilus assembly protein TadE [Sinomonas humi]